MRRLLAWFAAHARDLPWRRTRDPYAIWISEIMLQQTQVKTVLPYWERWMRALPDVGAVARARSVTLHKLWEGLGYYGRVRNLQRAARRIVREHGGRVPERFEELLALPGVGRYTAGAIASIAFNQPRPVLDGNVTRVLTRLFGIAGDPREAQTRARLWALAEMLVQEAARLREWERPCSQFNQALMELGALICTPRAPKCADCPLQTACTAHRAGRPESFPARRRAAPALRKRVLVLVLAYRGRFLVRQRPPTGVNARLWEFPNVELAGSEAGAGPSRDALRRALCNGQPSDAPARRDTGPLPSTLSRLTTLQHSITRYRFTLDVYGGEISDTPPRWPGRWLSLRQLQRLPLAGAHRKILARLMLR
ncbi:MAG: A/G-specific adenine glycosylase [Verrucomicrobiae bacterium]|nr:A/G-specific adenine glycosylase [Verrucomicrobiae bacterium]